MQTLADGRAGEQTRPVVQDIVDFLDHFMFLGNCPPTPPLSHYFALSEKEVLVLVQGRGRWAVSQAKLLLNLTCPNGKNQVRCPLTKSLTIRQARSGLRQAKFQNCLPKGQACIQDFFRALRCNNSQNHLVNLKIKLWCKRPFWNIIKFILGSMVQEFKRKESH